MIENQERADTGTRPAERNFRAWVAYQFLYRVGWQFKMEATLIAGLVSWLSPSAAIIGIFSTANSVGRYLGPLAATPWVDRSPSKKRCLLWFWAATTLCWGAGALFLWTPGAMDRQRTLWWFFFTYTAFFAFLGCTNVAQGALLGKIIPADRRGTALSLTHTLSGPINLFAILAVYSLVRSGGFPAPRNYALAFTITTVLFVLAGLAIAFAREKPSDVRHARAGVRARVRHAVRTARTNRNFRLLLLVYLALELGETMLPFFTPYGRKAGSINETNIMLATVIQVVCQSFSCVWLGRVADRRGNRLLICSLAWIEAVIPVAAVLAAAFFPGSPAYLLVYCLIGLRFPMFQMMTNYLLEVIPEADHALALGSVNSLLMFTIPAPILMGALADRMGYPAAMLLAALGSVLAALIATRLKEPRAGTSS